MPLWIFCGLCIVLLIESGAASDVPFVFDKDTSGISNYTSTQLEQAHTSYPDLAGVPSISTPSDNATLNFPVVGGGRTPQGTNEKKVSDLRKLFDSRVEPEYPTVHVRAVDITSNYPGDYTVDQVSAIFSHLVEKWHYIGDPRGVNDFFYANETLKRGEKANCVGVGDCGDFAILMSALVESIGGTTRIVLASNNTTGGHAYAQVYVGRDNAQDSETEDVIRWLKQEFETNKIFTCVDTDTKDIWLNLDWWPAENGSPRPGGPFFTGDKNIVLYIRENYSKSKVPLKLPEKTNKPPKLISLISDKPSPQVSGTVLTWTAKARDPDKDQMFYKFFLNADPVTTSWVKNNTWIWTTNDTDVGENQIEVRVRDGKYGHALPNGFDDRISLGFNITEPMPKPKAPIIKAPENQPSVNNEPDQLNSSNQLTNLNVEITNDVYKEQDRRLYYCANNGRISYKNRIYLVGPDLDKVAKVHYTLDPSFYDAEPTSENPSNNFEIWIMTWGRFPMKATITTKNGQEFEKTYAFSFKSKVEDALARGIPQVSDC